MRRIAIVGAAVLAAGTTLAAVRAVTPNGWNGKVGWQLKRHQEKMAEIAAKGGAKIVLLGDSITHNWETVGARQLERYLSQGDYRALNLGYSGATTDNTLWQIANGELDGYEAKCIVLMIGTNNTGHRSFAEEPPIDTIMGISRVLSAIREKQPKARVVLNAIFPRGKHPNDPLRLRNATVNREIMKFADGKDVFWLDMTDRFLLADGTLPREACPDFLHPGELGYELWYAALKPYFDYALSDGRLPVPPNSYASFRPGVIRQDSPATISPTTRIGARRKNSTVKWWDERLLEKRTQISESNGAIDLVFLGDSITHFWETNGANYLKRLRQTYSVLDLGYSGDRTEHLLWRIQNGELEGYKATCIMLMIGTNNPDKPQDVALGIRKILDTIAERQPQAQVLLLPIFPRGDKADNPARVKNEQVNELICGYADGKRVVWLDFNSRFVDENGDTRGTMTDRLHPNPGGYHIWMDAVLPDFKRICGK